MRRTADHAYAELLRRFKEWTVLGSCASALGWDEQTYMPAQGSPHRAEQMALLARLAHQLLTDPAIAELLADIEASSPVADPDSLAAANVREIRRVHDRAVKMPARLVEALARTTTLAQQAWREARRDKSFVAFLPWLEKVI